MGKRAVEKVVATGAVVAAAGTVAYCTGQRAEVGAYPRSTVVTPAPVIFPPSSPTSTWQPSDIIRPLPRRVTVDGDGYHATQIRTRQQAIRGLLLTELANTVGFELGHARIYQCPRSENYYILQESHDPNDRLDDWLTHCFNDHQLLHHKPRRLGLAIALQLLSGNTEATLHSYVRARGNHHAAYPIKLFHGTATATFVNDAESALKEGIKEYRDEPHTSEKSYSFINNLHRFWCRNCTSHGVTAEKLEHAKPALLEAIDADIQNGSIKKLYTDIALLTDEQLEQIVDAVDVSLSIDEKQEYIQSLQTMKTACLEHLKPAPPSKFDKLTQLYDGFRHK